MALHILTLIIIFVSSYYVGNNKAIERTQTRLERLDSDGGSGRTKNIENIIERVKTAPTVNQIFGYGFMGHAAKYHKMVDVEVFAILYYYGIVGWLVYIVIHIWLIRKICYLYRIRDVIGSNVLSSYSTCYSILIFYVIALGLNYIVPKDVITLLQMNMALSLTLYLGLIFVILTKK